MSDESRKAALEKLHNIFFECGHPTTCVNRPTFLIIDALKALNTLQRRERFDSDVYPQNVVQVDSGGLGRVADFILHELHYVVRAGLLVVCRS